VHDAAWGICGWLGEAAHGPRLSFDAWAHCKHALVCCAHTLQSLTRARRTPARQTAPRWPRAPTPLAVWSCPRAGRARAPQPAATTTGWAARVCGSETGRDWCRVRTASPVSVPALVTRSSTDLHRPIHQPAVCIGCRGWLCGLADLHKRCICDEQRPPRGNQREQCLRVCRFVRIIARYQLWRLEVLGAGTCRD
jgi:hypothetical protein